MPLLPPTRPTIKARDTRRRLRATDITSLSSLATLHTLLRLAMALSSSSLHTHLPLLANRDMAHLLPRVTATTSGELPRIPLSTRADKTPMEDSLLTRALQVNMPVGPAALAAQEVLMETEVSVLPLLEAELRLGRRTRLAVVC